MPEGLNFNGIVEPLPTVRRAPTVGGDWTKRVRPELVPHVTEILGKMKEAGYDVRVGETNRTVAQQADKIAQGYSRVKNPGKGPHVGNVSRAIDLIVYENGKPDWSGKSPAWKMIGDETRRRGLGWGGDIKDLYDPGHIQVGGGLARKSSRLGQSQTGLNFDGIVEPVESTSQPTIRRPSRSAYGARAEQVRTRPAPAVQRPNAIPSAIETAQQAAQIASPTQVAIRAAQSVVPIARAVDTARRTAESKRLSMGDVKAVERRAVPPGMKAVGPAEPDDRTMAQRQAPFAATRDWKADVDQLLRDQARLEIAGATGNILPHSEVELGKRYTAKRKILDEALRRNPELQNLDPVTVANQIAEEGNIREEPAIVRPVHKAGLGLGEGAVSSVGSGLNRLANVVDLVNIGPESSKLDELKKISGALRSEGQGMQTSATARDLIAPAEGSETFTRPLFRGAGALPGELAQLAALGKNPLPKMGALEGSEEGPAAAIKGAAHGYLYQLGMGATAKLSPTKNALIWTAVPALESKAENPDQSWGAAVGGALPMGALAFMHGGKAEVIENGKRRVARPSDLEAIESGQLEVVPPQLRTPVEAQSTGLAYPTREIAKREGLATIEEQLKAKAPAKFQHKDFGEVSEAPNQSGVGKGRVRVVDAEGNEHLIQRPNKAGAGNIRAIPVKEVKVEEVESAFEQFKGGENDLIVSRSRLADRSNPDDALHAKRVERPLPPIEGRENVVPREARVEPPRVAVEESKSPPQRIVPHDEYRKAPRDAKGHVDTAALLAPIQSRMAEAIKEGRKVELVLPDENKRVTIRRMVNGMAEDANGNRWGVGSMLFAKKGRPKEYIEISTPRETLQERERQSITSAPTENLTRSVALAPTAPTEPVRKERSLPKTLERAGHEKGTDLTYEAITNKETLAAAQRKIQRSGLDGARAELYRKTEFSPVDEVVGYELIRQYEQKGNYDKASEVASELSRKLTEAGQIVQAASMIARLSPEGVLLAAQKQLKPGQKLSEEQSKTLIETAARVREADKRIGTLESQLAELNKELAAKQARGQRRAKFESLQEKLAKAEADARARLASRVGVGKGGEVGASSIPLDIADYAIIGASKLARKGISLAQWSSEMLGEFGDEIKPHLRAIYKRSYKQYDDLRREMLAERERRGALKGQPENLSEPEVQRLIDERITARKDARTARAELARLFTNLTMTGGQRAKAIAGDILNIPRTLKSSVDLSAPRQGAMWMFTHPKEGVKLFFGKHLKAMKETNYDRFVDELESDPDFRLMQRSGLDLTTVAKESAPFQLNRREEAFVSRIAGRLPGVKHSERAYTTFLDTARSSWFKQLARQAEDAAKQVGRQVRPEEYQAIAKFVNIGTGRGDLGRGWVSNMSPILNAVFFAPRYAASKVQVFDPRVYARLPKGARKTAIKQAVQYFGTLAATAAILKYGFNQNVGTDPEESDFGKVTVGNTHYDLTFGQAQYFTLAARLARNAQNKIEGKPDGFGKSFADNVDRFLRYKYAPIPAFTRNVWEGKNAIGEKTTAKAEALEMITPLMLNDMIDAYKEEGFEGVAKTSPAIVGVGVNTYGPRPQPIRRAAAPRLQRPRKDN